MSAAASIADERERCPSCGLRPDMHAHVEADMIRCPGCAALETVNGKARKAQGDMKGYHASFFPVSDARTSVWMQTQKGAEWRARHRDDPPGAFPTADDLGDDG